MDIFLTFGEFLILSAIAAGSVCDPEVVSEDSLFLVVPQVIVDSWSIDLCHCDWGRMKFHNCFNLHFLNY